MNTKIEILVKGRLDKKRQIWFEDMTFNYVDSNTIICGEIKDESHLHGILNKIRDLNMKLISVNPSL